MSEAEKEPIEQVESEEIEYGEMTPRVLSVLLKKIEGQKKKYGGALIGIEDEIKNIFQALESKDGEKVVDEAMAGDQGEELFPVLILGLDQYSEGFSDESLDVSVDLLAEHLGEHVSHGQRFDFFVKRIEGADKKWGRLTSRFFSRVAERVNEDYEYGKEVLHSANPYEHCHHEERKMWTIFFRECLPTIKRIVEEEGVERIFPIIRWAVDRREMWGGDVTELVKDMVSEEISSCGLDPEETLKVWYQNAFEVEINKRNIESRTGELVVENLMRMREVEKVKENPGLIKALHDRFGLTVFSRYPASMLIDQYEKMDDETIPYGVMVFPRYDHNGSFDHMRREMMDMQSTLSKNGHHMRIYETGSKLYLYKLLAQGNKRYNSSGENKAKFAIVCGHGNPSSITLGEKKGEWSRRHTLYSNDLNPKYDKKAEKGGAPFNEEFQKMIDPDGQIVLVSCSTGKGSQSIAEYWSWYLDVETIAPGEDARAENFNLKFVDGKPRFEPWFENSKSEKPRPGRIFPRKTRDEDERLVA